MANRRSPHDAAPARLRLVPHALIGAFCLGLLAPLVGRPPVALAAAGCGAAAVAAGL